MGLIRIKPTFSSRNRALSGAVFYLPAGAAFRAMTLPLTTKSRAPLSPHARGVMLMLASTVFFTANVLLTRLLGEVQAVDVWLICCARFVVGLVLIGLFFRREFQPVRLVRSRKLAERGIVGGLGVFGFYLTVVHIGAGRATFINTTYIGIGALLAVWILGERFRVSVAAGSLIALTGLALLTNAFGATAQAGYYDLVAVAVALGSAWVVITIRQLHATDTPPPSPPPSAFTVCCSAACPRYFTGRRSPSRRGACFF